MKNSDGHDQDVPLSPIQAAAAAAAAGATQGALRALAARRGQLAEDEELDTADEGEEAADEPDERPEADRRQPQDEQPAVSAAEPGELRDLTRRARELLVELRGVDAETVSGLTRSREGWIVTLEVVELRRVPESTDVLATYEVELDEDGRLLGYGRRGRYSRSQAGRGGE